MDNQNDLGEYMEHFLSLGLNWLQQVVMASTYEERYELLAPNLAPDSGWHLIPAVAGLDDVPISELGEAERNAMLPPPIMVDADWGPKDIWFWAFARNTLAYTYYGPEHKNYRKRGYVMFNYDRLCKWDAFHEPFDRLAANKERNAERLSDERLAEKETLMKRSQDERTNVWLRGGTGWWSEGRREQAGLD